MLSEFSFHCGRTGRWQCLRRGGTILQGQDSLPGTQLFVPAQSLAHGRYSNACWIKEGLEGQGSLAVETQPQEMGSGDGDVMSWGTGSQDLTSSFWICRELWFAVGPVVLVLTCQRVRSQWWLELLQVPSWKPLLWLYSLTGLWSKSHLALSPLHETPSGDGQWIPKIPQKALVTCAGRGPDAVTFILKRSLWCLSASGWDSKHTEHTLLSFSFSQLCIQGKMS